MEPSFVFTRSLIGIDGARILSYSWGIEHIKFNTSKVILASPLFIAKVNKFSL